MKRMKSRITATVRATDVFRTGEAWLPTEYARFRAVAFRDLAHDQDHLALVLGRPERGPALVRVHSECLTGDALGSLRCDCGPQASAALRRIAAEGEGVFVYLRQEGRGIGLGHKIRAYALQDEGADTVDANLRLGFEADGRDFTVAGRILAELGIARARLLTNNPRKIDGLERGGVAVVERVALEIEANSINDGYLATKRRRLGHWLSRVGEQ